ncbi:protein TEX261 [Episyrphus balteatus]|uniref:protein TEX261 n=1 Tax=Episyrphus balteatus TaxID=286459 RepID=UPI0024852304|nr:protein TEX261 [Episyrphus balteatus]
MGLLYFLSYFSLALQICFVTMAIAAGLYYLAELVEEYSVFAKKFISSMIGATFLLYIAFIFFENLSWNMVFCGFGAQFFHFCIMKNFPNIRFLSFSFFGAVIFLILNHLLAFQYFTTNLYPFSEVLGYFIICLWLVPFALFISLSANDNVLPTLNDHILHNGNPDVVSNYFSRRQKKQGLLSLFLSAKEVLAGGQKNKVSQNSTSPSHIGVFASFTRTKLFFRFIFIDKAKACI